MQKQGDSALLFFLWLLTMLFLRIPTDYLVAKILCFGLIVCCFTVSGLLLKWDQIIEAKKNEW
jgi:hypothetical protein